MSNKVRSVQLFKLPSGKSKFWYVRYFEHQADGTWKERWKSTKTEIRKDAEVVRRKIERDLEDQPTRRKDLRWDDFVTEFIEKHARRKAASTIQSYQCCLRVFGDTAKPRFLSSITAASLEDYANRRLAEQISPATINKDLRHLKSALRWAAERNYLEKAPSFRRAFTRVDVEPPRVISEELFRSVVTAIGSPDLQLEYRSAGWWRTFLYLGYYTGLRRGELINVTWGQLSFTTKELVVTKSKSRRFRVVPLAEGLVDILRRWRDEQGTVKGHEKILSWPNEELTHLYDDLHAIQTQAGLPREEHFGPQVLRATCASNLIAAGVPTAVVKEILGHQHITTTERHYINAAQATHTAVARVPVWNPETCRKDVEPDDDELLLRSCAT